MLEILWQQVEYAGVYNSKYGWVSVFGIRVLFIEQSR